MAAPIGNCQGLKWLPAHDAALRRYFALGYSLSQCAVKINSELSTTYSRNATIGRAHRLKLSDPKMPVRRPTVAKERELTSPRWTFGAPRKRRPPPPPVDVTAMRCAKVEPRNVGLLDLGPVDCRFPYGDGPYSFCGHKKLAGEVYCDVHFQLCRGTMR